MSDFVTADLSCFVAGENADGEPVYLLDGAATLAELAGLVRTIAAKRGLSQAKVTRDGRTAADRWDQNREQR